MKAECEIQLLVSLPIGPTARPTTRSWVGATAEGAGHAVCIRSNRRCTHSGVAQSEGLASTKNRICTAYLPAWLLRTSAPTVVARTKESLNPRAVQALKTGPGHCHNIHHPAYVQLTCLPACLPACLYIPDTRMQISFINILCFVGTLPLKEGILFNTKFGIPCPKRERCIATDRFAWN